MPPEVKQAIPDASIQPGKVVERPCIAGNEKILQRFESGCNLEKIRYFGALRGLCFVLRIYPGRIKAGEGQITRIDRARIRSFVD